MQVAKMYAEVQADVGVCREPKVPIWLRKACWQAAAQWLDW
jgi:hypothetical protein